MKCKYGEWGCPYVEETHGCCIKERCPEYQDNNNNYDVE